MLLIANGIGLAAVAMFVLSYQLKTRRWILFFNAGSRLLYMLQYILLGAWEGLVLDGAAFLVSVLAQRKHSPWIREHTRQTVWGSNLFLIGMGLLCYQNFYSLIPIFGVLFETGALWRDEEKKIRLLSLLGAPFWLAYNLIYGAYGSAVGNVLTLVSIGLAMLRYDLKRKPAR